MRLTAGLPWTMPIEVFAASRWTPGNHLFPTIVEVTDPIASHGPRKADARRIKDLIEAAQRDHLPAAPVDGPTRHCPSCAETIKQAATVCRYCGRELP